MSIAFRVVVVDPVRVGGSVALRAGVPTKVVSDRLGHLDPDHGGHFTAHVGELDRDAAEIVAALYRSGDARRDYGRRIL